MDSDLTQNQQKKKSQFIIFFTTLLFTNEKLLKFHCHFDHFWPVNLFLQVSTKSVKQCIQFYYVWKKVCPDDYKRLRHSRNKHGDYNTRRQTERAAAQAAAEAAEKAEIQRQQQQQEEQSEVPQVEEMAEDGSAGLLGMEEGEAISELDNLSTVSDNEDGSMAGPDVSLSTSMIHLLTLWNENFHLQS